MERKKQEKFVTYRQKHAFDSFGLYDAGSCCAAVFWPVSAFLEQRPCAGLYPFPLYKDRTQAAILFPCTKTVRRPPSFSLCIAESFMV
jgi:hypothetical protein